MKPLPPGEPVDLRVDAASRLAPGVVGHLVSLSLLGADPSDVAFRVDPSSPPPAFVVSGEQVGASPQPTSAPVATTATG